MLRDSPLEYPDFVSWPVLLPGLNIENFTYLLISHSKSTEFLVWIRHCASQNDLPLQLPSRTKEKTEKQMKNRIFELNLPRRHRCHRCKPVRKICMQKCGKFMQQFEFGGTLIIQSMRWRANPVLLGLTICWKLHSCYFLQEKKWTPNDGGKYGQIFTWSCRQEK